jgi:hypothetical protein
VVAWVEDRGNQLDADIGFGGRRILGRLRRGGGCRRGIGYGPEEADTSGSGRPLHSLDGFGITNMGGSLSLVMASFHRSVLGVLGHELGAHGRDEGFRLFHHLARIAEFHCVAGVVSHQAELLGTV